MDGCNKYANAKIYIIPLANFTHDKENMK